MKTLEERFWAKVDKRGPDECWLWIGAINGHGYGSIHAPGRYSPVLTAHRVSWTLHRGPIPKGLYVCHTCDVRYCVNPDHLWIGTHADNMADCRAKGRGRGPEGETQHDAKLTRSQVFYIRYTRIPQRKLAAELGCSKTQIGRIRRRESWAWP